MPPPIPEEKELKKKGSAATGPRKIAAGEPALSPLASTVNKPEPKGSSVSLNSQ